MIKFNPENKDLLTYRECLGPAMEITDPQEAAQYLNDYVAWQEKHMTEASVNYTVEEVCKINIGYYAGYYSSETRERVERLFNTSHPIFGSIKSNGSPTPEKAFSMGQQAAQNPERN